jgi:hypothetical protein
MVVFDWIVATFGKKMKDILFITKGNQIGFVVKLTITLDKSKFKTFKKQTDHLLTINYTSQSNLLIFPQFSKIKGQKSGDLWMAQLSVTILNIYSR